MRSAYIAEPFGEHITDARDTDLGTRNGQLRHLVANLGVTRAQAKRLLMAWLKDCADETRIGNHGALPDAEFLRRLQSEAPFGMGHKPHVRKWQVGEGGGWAVRS